jgi:predicted transcriptional regulator
MSSMTTIRISHQTKELLDDLKHHKKESYEDVIGRLAAMACDEEPLSFQEIKDMKAGLDDIRAGHVTPKKRLKDSLYRQDAVLPGGGRESAGGLLEDETIESRLRAIVSRLDRIEEEIHEKVYPPESALRPEFVRKVRKARSDIRGGRGKVYASVDDFFRETEA